MNNVKVQAYLAFCIMGTIFPYIELFQWINENTFSLNSFISASTDDGIDRFAWMEILLTAFVLFYAVIKSTIPKSHKVYTILATCVVGISLGLPLFMLFNTLAEGKRNINQQENIEIR